MRSLLAVALICGSTILAKGEEAYKQTFNQLGTCYGLQMREIMTPGNKIISTEALDDLLKQKCGLLEDRAHDEFVDFLNRQIGRTLSTKEHAETMFEIILELQMSHTRGGIRRTLVEGYRTAVTTRGK